MIIPFQFARDMHDTALNEIYLSCTIYYLPLKKSLYSLLHHLLFSLSTPLFVVLMFRSLFHPSP